MADPQTPAAPRCPRRIRLLLTVSLAANLLVAGLVAGAFIKGMPDGPRGDIARDMGFGVFDEALTREDRGHLKEAFRTAAPPREDLRRLLRQDVEALLAALRARPFDPAALDAALAVQRQRMQDRLDLGQRLMRDRLVAMSDADRQAFAQRLESALQRRESHGTHMDRPGP